MSTKTILLVDRTDENKNLIIKTLTEREYIFFSASSFEEAIKILEKHHIQLVIVGSTLLEIKDSQNWFHLKERFPSTIQLALVDINDFNLIESAIKSKYLDRFIFRPWKNGELKLIVEQCFDLYDAIQEKVMLNQKIHTQNIELQRVKTGLEELIQNQTHSLNLAQELLYNLPVPVIGISSEEIIVYTNEAVGKEIVSLGQISLGTSIHLCFSKGLIDAILRCLAKKNHTEWLTMHINNQDIKVCLRTLTHNSSIRGCVLVVEEVRYAK